MRYKEDKCDDAVCLLVGLLIGLVVGLLIGLLFGLLVSYLLVGLLLELLLDCFPLIRKNFFFSFSGSTEKTCFIFL